MRILLVTHRFLPRYLAGTEVYTGLLGRSLRERGHIVRVFTGDPSASEAYRYEWEGLTVDAVPWRAGQSATPVYTFLAGFRNPHVERQFAQVCTELKPDIVHIQHLMGLSPHLPDICRRHSARVLITLHDYWFECSNTMLLRYTNEPCPGPGIGYHCGGCALQRLGHEPNPLSMTLTAPVFSLRTAVLHRVLQSADRVIAPSHIAAQVFAVQAALNGKLVVIPHGLSEPGDPRPSQPAAASRPLQLLYVGSLIRPKGVHIIVQAFNALPESQAELHLYGDLTADAGYVAELRQNAPRSGVFFHGPLDRQLVAGALQNAGLVLVPTLLREAFSILVDEAFEAGVPVLVSAGSAAAERVIDGLNGLVAKAGDVEAWRRQLERVLAEPKLLARLREGVRPPKTLSMHTSEIENLYQQVAREAA